MSKYYKSKIKKSTAHKIFIVGAVAFGLWELGAIPAQLGFIAQMLYAMASYMGKALGT